LTALVVLATTRTAVDTILSCVVQASVSMLPNAEVHQLAAVAGGAWQAGPGMSRGGPGARVAAGVVFS